MSNQPENELTTRLPDFSPPKPEAPKKSEPPPNFGGSCGFGGVQLSLPGTSPSRQTRRSGGA